MRIGIVLVSVIYLMIFLSSCDSSFDWNGDSSCASSEVVLSPGDVGDSLNAKEKRLYLLLKDRFSSVAVSGGSTRFELSFADLGFEQLNFTDSELGVSIFDGNNMSDACSKKLTDFASYPEDSFRRVYYALLADLPFTMFWFDEDAGFQMTVNYQVKARMVDGKPMAFYSVDERPASLRDVAVIFSAPVSIDFSDGTQESVILPDGTQKSLALSVDPKKAMLAQRCTHTADAIIKKNRDKSDYEKIVAYKNAILSETDYAPDAFSRPFGITSQLISVFDDDPSTYSVCGGYARAFQYLCDHSSFSSDRIRCKTVVGSCDHALASGIHAWNLITMDDGNTYLVDITACDTFGFPDQLFLKGFHETEGTFHGCDLSYSFSCATQGGVSEVSYTYLPVYYSFDGLSDFLTLSSSDYRPSSPQSLP